MGKRIKHPRNSCEDYGYELDVVGRWEKRRAQDVIAYRDIQRELADDSGMNQLWGGVVVARGALTPVAQVRALPPEPN